MTAQRKSHKNLVEWAPAAVLETLTDGISIQDLDMRIVYANSTHRQYFGPDIVGEHCYRIYERRDHVCEGCPVQESYRTGKPASAVRVGIDKNGVPWFADIVATPLRNPQGEIVGAVEAVRNITERKLIEQEADRRNRETAALAEVAMALNRYVELDDILRVALERTIDVCGADAGILRLLDKENGVLVPKAWSSPAGLPINENILAPVKIGVGFLGRAAERGELVVIDDSVLMGDRPATEHAKEILKHGVKSMIIAPLMSQDKLAGTLALASRQESKFGEAGRGLLAAIASQIAVSIDNSRLLEKTRRDAVLIKAYSEKLERQVEVKEDELAESESKFKTLVQHANTAILVFDREKRIVEANRAAGDLLGCEPSGLIGSLPSQLNCCSAFDLTLPQVLGGETLEGFVHEVTTCRGDRKLVVTNAAPVKDARGAISGSIASFIDITEIKRPEC